MAENADLSRKITENEQKLVKLRENMSKRLKNAGILNEKYSIYGTGYYPNSIFYGSKQTRFLVTAQMTQTAALCVIQCATRLI